MNILPNPLFDTCDGSVLFIGLNRKGGGPRYTLDTYEEYLKVNRNASLIWNRNADVEITSSLNAGIIEVEYPKRTLQLMNYFSRRKASGLFERVLEEKQITHVVFTMPHPWDLDFATIAQKRGIQVHRIIHDSQAHPGEIWPTKFYIKKSIRTANHHYVLSQYVSDQLRKKFKVEAKILPPRTLQLVNDEVERMVFGKYILFVGRIKKYKGLTNLLDAWEKIPHFEYSLCVAGEGKFKTVQKDTIFINRWLKENEIINLIKNADLVVFPYIEASQSGLLPIAIKLNREVLISDKGGLSEQCQGYSKTLTFDYNEVNDLEYKLISFIHR